MALVPTISTGAIRKLLTTLAEAGLDHCALAADLDLDEEALADIDRRVPIATLHALWEEAMARLPRDAALAGAERYEPGDYGLVGFVAMNSATLGEGLGHVVRYARLWTDDPVMTLSGSTLEVDYRTRFADRLGLRMATEAALAEILHGARLLTHTRIVPKEVRFAHQPPRNIAPWEAFFGCPVTFGASRTSMRFRPGDLDLGLPKADAQLGTYLRKTANEALARRGGDATPLDRARNVIAEQLQTGVPTLERVARGLAMSGRTLRRRLEEEDTSFRALLDQTREHLARSYVADPAMPLVQVAFLLGFSDPSAFHRAFKRWTKTTPAAFRAAARKQRG